MTEPSKSVADTPLDAGQPCPDLAARRVNFFSGRLLGADDLRQEQSTVSQRDRWLGQALGDGVVRGLELTGVAGSGNLLQVEAGLAVNACGEPLALDKPLRLRLAPTTSKSGSGGFAPCGSEAGFSMDQGEGYYLVSLGPAVGLSDEKAQEIGRNGQLIACGARWQLEGIALHVDKIPASALPAALRVSPPVSSPAALSRARSVLAGLCLGETLASAPLGRPADDLLHAAKLASSQRVPLAVVAWTSAGVAFVDRWSVRRRPTPDIFTSASAAYWPTAARRAAQAEALQHQFQEHLAELLEKLPASGIAPASLVAGEWFAWLPAVGVVSRAGKSSGISAAKFFAALPIRPGYVARAALEALLLDGQSYPTIDLAKKPAELLWLYQLVEDRDVLVFANGHIPPANPPRFDLARCNAAYFPDGEL